MLRHGSGAVDNKNNSDCFLINLYTQILYIFEKKCMTEVGNLYLKVSFDHFQEAEVPLHYLENRNIANPLKQFMGSLKQPNKI